MPEMVLARAGAALRIPALTPAARDPAYSTFILPGGVMVAQVTLTHLVMVRIHAGQPLPRSLAEGHGFEPWFDGAKRRRDARRAVAQPIGRRPTNPCRA